MPAVVAGIFIAKGKLKLSILFSHRSGKMKSSIFNLSTLANILASEKRTLRPIQAISNLLLQFQNIINIDFY
jgi:hypothetical protein